MTLPIAHPLSPVVEAIPPHGTRAIAALAAGREDVINLTLGEPDFATPLHIAEAGIAAVNAGHTRYAPGGGLPALRDAAAAAVTARAGANVTPEQVVVTGVACAPGESFGPGAPGCFASRSPRLRRRSRRGSEGSRVRCAKRLKGLA